ncbi:hypothetical protein BKA62DRAFT_721470 [Auriculariales sp. MPI-PUGE-AT-0066]|nr:hypothetical protein BKA62DRAFT_721470 [Auriculariales sp. MPI-PUGE-AT-0066]
MFHFAFRTLVATYALLPLVHASFYPTKPTASTWYTVSIEHRGIHVKWRDTNEDPRADTLGQLQVQLLGPQGVVTELWPLIDSSEKEATVYVPKRISLGTASDYYLRFVPGGENWNGIYTSSFTLVNSTAPPVSNEAVQSAKDALNAMGTETASSGTVAATTTTTITNTTTTMHPNATTSASRSSTIAAATTSLGNAAAASQADSSALVMSPTLPIIALSSVFAGVFAL